MKFEIDKQTDKTIFKLETKSLDHNIAAAAIETPYKPANL